MRRWSPRGGRLSRAFLSVLATVLAGAASALLGVCGPFTDVSDAAFCPFVLEIFTLGITTGTTPTTYDPTSSVSRLQMAAFLSRTVDGALKRGNARAALDQFWTPKNSGVLGLTTVGSLPVLVASDGTDLWVTNNTSNTVSRVRASDGRLLETWTGATGAFGVLVAMGEGLRRRRRPETLPDRSRPARGLRHDGLDRPGGELGTDDVRRVEDLDGQQSDGLHRDSGRHPPLDRD
jgi:hypothetical protein